MDNCFLVSAEINKLILYSSMIKSTWHERILHDLSKKKNNQNGLQMTAAASLPYIHKFINSLTLNK